MRRCFIAIALSGIVSLAACSDPPAPAGRWQGVYESGDAMIVARLQIGTDGIVRVSAPNAFFDFTAMTAEERVTMRDQLLNSLAQAWPAVAPMPLSFDGKIFRKPGGVAPQLEWDSEHRRMTLIVYPGSHATIRMPLQSVKQFGEETS